MRLRSILPLLLAMHCGPGAGRTPTPESPTAFASKADSPPPGSSPLRSDAAGPLDLSTQEAFTRTVATRITERVAGANVKVAESLLLKVQIRGGDALDVSLDRIWHFCVETPARCDAEVGLLEGALRDSTAKETLTADMLAVVVRNSEYVESIRQRKASIVVEPLAGDLFILYMVDVGSRARGAGEDDFAKLGLNRAAATKLARENTARKLGLLSTRVHRGTEPVACVARGNFYESSALVETEAWAQLPKTDAPLLASAPSADALCYAWKSDETTIALFRKTTAALFQAASRPVSRTVLRWTGSGWRPLP